MHKILIAIAGSLACTAALASECPKGGASALLIKSWELSDVKNDSTREFTFHIESTLAKPTRMVEGTIWFKDALGRRLNGWHIDPDFKISAKGQAPFILSLGTANFDGRLARLSRSDIDAKLCVESVLYDDGTKEEFK